MSKNQKSLESFVDYCKANPDERFWQALRNWDRGRNRKTQFILTAEAFDMETGKFINIRDTFYYE